jgi:hypothetical protein
MVPNLVHTIAILVHSSFWVTNLQQIRAATALDLRFRRRKLASLLLVLESGGFVRSVAERLVCRVAAPAEREDCASGKAIGLALHVNEFDFAFDAQRAVITNDNFSCSHSSSAFDFLEHTQNPSPASEEADYNLTAGRSAGLQTRGSSVQRYCTAKTLTEKLKHRHSEGTPRAEELLFLFAFNLIHN